VIITDRLRLVTLWEPPYADPHVRWCGGRGRKTPGYPIEAIHDRMLVILAPGDYPMWLSKHLTDPEQLKPLYQPFPAGPMETYPVSDLVNSLRNNSPENIRRAAI